MNQRGRAPSQAVITRALALIACALAALSGCQSKPPEPAAAPAIQERLPASVFESRPRLLVDVSHGPTPWTHLDAKNAEDNFQFAIVTDRTGGHRPGVFASAIHKLNLLQPEFVVSVGDLIEGYTEDRAQLEREWNEFDGMVAELEAPFFYLPGNHDITNSTMREIWHDRYGPSRYRFVYKDVLFVCMDSMDGGVHQIGEEQLEWLESTLQAHRDVHWTLLFLHTPFWDDGDGEGTPTWERVEAILGQRNYTAFAGHYHRYTKHVRNDRKHFTLATTGGISSLRGPRYGEFDHVVWVTMSPRGPRIANLMLDGIWDEDVRNEDIRQLQKALFQRSMFPTPVFFERSFKSGTSQLRLYNTEDYPYELSIELEPPPGIQVQPQRLEVTVPPNSVVDKTFEVSSAEALVAPVAQVPVQFVATAHVQTQEVVFRSRSAIGLVQSLVAPKRQGVVVDARLDDWKGLPHAVNVPRQVLQQAEAWRGVEDNRFSLGVAHDDEYLYVAVDVKDDELSSVRKLRPWEQDGVEIRIDARREPLRSHYGAARDGKDVLLLAMSPSDDPSQAWLRKEGWMHIPDGVRAACQRTTDGFIAEVAVPRSWAEAQSGDGVQQIRVNVAVDDKDADGQSQSWWWPDWRSAEQIPGSGTFTLKN